MLDERGGIQWPLPEGDDVAPPASGGCSRTAASTTPTAGRASSSRRRAPMPEPTDARYPFVLLTGRGSVQPVAHADAHRRSRPCCASCTRTSSYVEINPADAARRSASTPNEWVVVESQRGAMRARAFVTHVVQPGQVFMPMHYATTNRLTLADLRPLLAPAVVQALRRPRPPGQRRPGVGPRRPSAGAISRAGSTSSRRC